jgi:hypothetical protein
MGRTINGTNKADRIEQGTDFGIRVFAKGGNDLILLDRDDDLKRVASILPHIQLP